MGQQSPLILVVDDEPDIGWSLSNILKPAGFGVITATNGIEALELLADGRFAVAFVDAKLPDMDGLELAALICQRSPHTVVVLISGYYYPEDKAIKEGLEKKLFFSYIAKPFELEEIRQAALRAIEINKWKENHNDPDSHC